MSMEITRSFVDCLNQSSSLLVRCRCIKWFLFSVCVKLYGIITLIFVFVEVYIFLSKPVKHVTSAYNFRTWKIEGVFKIF